METKDARIQTLEKQVTLLEAELQRIKECGGRLREQLLKATAVPSSGGGLQHQQQQSQQSSSVQQQQQQAQTNNNNNLAAGGIESQMRQGLVTAMGGGYSQQPGTLALARGPSVMTSLVPYGHTSSTALTSSLLAGSTGGTMSGVGGGGGSSCLAGISSGATTGVVNPYTDRYADHHLHQLHHHHHHFPHHHQPHLHHQQQQQLQLQHQQQMQQHLKQIEPAAQGALALHAHNFNKHDMNFKRQVSFFINNVRIEKNDAV
nr:mastermind-like domain-containing protein 1 [Nomia melanderi]